MGMWVMVGSPSSLCEQTGMAGCAMVRAVALVPTVRAVWWWSVQVAHNVHYQHHQGGGAQHPYRAFGGGVASAPRNTYLEIYLVYTYIYVLSPGAFRISLFSNAWDHSPAFAPHALCLPAGSEPERWGVAWDLVGTSQR